MNLYEFLEIAEKLFNIMHPNYCEEYNHTHDENDLWSICEEFFEQIGQQV